MNRVRLFCHTDLDGVGCAILAKLAFCDNVDISYCNYDNIDKEVLAWHFKVENMHTPVFITDISVSEETANILNENRNDAVLLDHHATALVLNKFSWCEVHIEDFDGTATCGTKLFFEHLFYSKHFNSLSNKSLHKLVEFVEMVRDYDTWRWKEIDGGIDCKRLNDLYYLYGTEVFINWVISRVKSPAYKYFPAFDEGDLALLENKQKEIDKYIEVKDKQMIRYHDTFGYICGVVFAERFFSELGNKLAEMHPELHYIAMIDISDGKVSYRGVRDDIDLGGEIAHSYGGGGHKKAAGSTFDGKSMELLVLDWLFNKGKTTREHIRDSIMPACDMYNDDDEFREVPYELKTEE